MIADCDFPEMRRMLAGPDMAAILVKGWPNIQWKIAKSDRLWLKYLASRYLDGNLTKDFTPCNSLIESTEQYRVHLRLMDWFHSTSAKDVTVQHADGEWWVYHRSSARSRSSSGAGTACSDQS